MKKLKYILVLCFVFVFFLVKAQNTLTLSDAIKIGLENNFQLEISSLNIAIAKNNDNWGEAGMLPTLDINLSQNNNISDQSNNPTSFIQDKLVTNNFNESVNLNWTIFNGFKVKTTKERLELLVKQSEGNAALVVESSLQSIVLAYYNCLLQKEKLNVLEVLVKNSRRKLDYANNKTDLGVNSSFDALQFKNTLLSDTTNYLMQELAYKNSLRNLLLVMGIDSLGDYQLSGKIEPPLMNFEFNELKNKMKSNNQNLINQFLNIELMNNNVELAESSLYPVVSFGAGAQAAQNRFRVGQLDGNGSTLNYFGNFTVSYRLFNGGKFKRAIQNAKLQERIAEVTLEEMQFKLDNELQSQLDLYDVRLSVLSVANESYQSAIKTLDLAEERFRAGVINSFNLRDIEIAFLNAAIVKLEAAYNLYSAYVDLLRITGGIIDVTKN